MSALSQFLSNPLPSSPKVNPYAGVALNDAIELGPDGLAYSAKTTDYATVGTIGQVVAQTSTTLAAINQTINSSGNVVQGTDGSIYLATVTSGGTGLLISRYLASGAAGNSVQVVATGTTISFAQLLLLSNGNLAVVYTDSSANLKIAVYAATTLAVVQAPAAVEQMAATNKWVAITTSGGGFAIYYSKVTSNDQRLVTYSNAGAQTLAPTTILAATAVDYLNFTQLSNGNLAFAYFVGTAGCKVGIFTIAGVSVVAFNAATGAPTGNNAWWPFLVAVASGYFGVAYIQAGANYVMALDVYSNAGAKQGTTGVGTGTATFSNTFRLLTDGTNFLGIYGDSSSKVHILTVPITGGANQTDVSIATLSSTYTDNFFFWENGCLVGTVTINAALVSTYFVYSTALSQLLVSATTFGSTAATTSGSIGSVAGGDFTFIAVYQQTGGPTGAQFYVGKYASTALLGQATAATAANSNVPIDVSPGVKPLNTLKGSVTKAFDHSATLIYGNKGTLLPNAISLKGM